MLLSPKETKLLAGDFRLSFQRLKLIIDYLIDIDLLQKKENTILSNELKSRFEGLLAKRTKDREGFRHRKHSKSGVSASESTQTKVKESKLKETKVYIKPPTPLKKELDLSFISDEKFKEVFKKWLSYRKEIKKPYKSEQTLKLKFKKLTDLSKNEVSLAEKIVNQSIGNGWTDIYDLKQDGNFGGNYNNTNPLKAVAFEDNKYDELGER